MCLLLHDAFQASSCQSICLQAAKATVFNGNFVYDVVSTVATEPDTEDGFFSDFSKMLGFFYGDIVGLEGASGLRSDQPGRRRVGKGDEFNNAASPSTGTSSASVSLLIPSYLDLNHRGISRNIRSQESSPCISQNNFSTPTYTGVSRD